MTENGAEPAKRRFRLLTRRVCLVPTWQGCLVGVALLACLISGFVLTVHRFLSVNAPVSSGSIVVEGWMSDMALDQTIQVFRKGHFDKVYVTGGPLDLGAPLSEYRTYAELSAAALLKLGLATNEVQAVPAPKVRQDRTYVSARALRRWFELHGTKPSQILLISEGVHSRRSRLVFEYAFPEGPRIGILALEPDGYDPAHWWRYSAGVRSVIGELLAYGYARILFHPTPDVGP